MDTPIEILLLRNESYDYFVKQKRKIIQDNEIYEDFKQYFREFIHSDLIKQILNEEHQNVLELIEADIFPGLFLDEEFIMALLYGKFAQGYTDKDILLSFIFYFTTIIDDFGIIDSKEKYENIKNFFFLFDVCAKFIITLHEVLIHLCYGYLWYLTEGEIESISPKQSKKTKNDSVQEEVEGYFFE